MLMALVLLSLIALGMVSAMFTMGQTQDRIDSRMARGDEFQSVTAFVQATLENLSSRPAEMQERGNSLYMFNGGPVTVEWLGVMPARHGMGGLYFFRLAVEPADAGQALVLRYQPWGGGGALPDWSSAHARILIPDVVNFDVGYGGRGMEPQQWEPVWTQAEGLPVRVRLSVVTRNGLWPLWIVATRAMPQGGGREAYSRGPGG